jgi:hypothetical protein
MTWRDTESYLSAEYLDADTGELLELIAIELPFRRAREESAREWRGGVSG